MVLQLAPPPQPLPRLHVRPRPSSSVFAVMPLPLLTDTYAVLQYFGPDASETITHVSRDFCMECAPYFGQPRRR